MKLLSLKYGNLLETKCCSIRPTFTLALNLTTNLTKPIATARELIADHLKGEGFSVVTAVGGVEALKLAKELRPTAA
jgi:hypothetical protein